MEYFHKQLFMSLKNTGFFISSQTKWNFDFYY